MSIDWNTYIYRCPTRHCASYKTHQKYHFDYEDRRACVPRLIWSDGHSEWSRWYWFKDGRDRMGKGYYIGFNR